MTAALSTVQTARLEARISASLHSLLKRAAQLEGRTMTDFVIDAVHTAAREAIEKSDSLHLMLSDQEAFAKALLSPPKPNAALKRAFARREKLLASA